MQINRTGVTRTVILTNSLAIKIPTFKSLQLFLSGWQANIQEATFGDVGFICLNQVKASFLKDLVVVHKRIKPVNHKGLFWVEQKQLEISSKVKYLHESDKKPENYGYDNGVLKRLDFGS
ncbi:MULTISPECIES: hypothetical protein [Acinetobacter]|uniref:hypothetical protein n=1 Tax=Acinetobacter TaxID=469 RepID=UPI000C4131AC|nr:MULTISPECIES: hypothetical protein [Acinetobacter]MBC70435.1 hypothetical protein [Acinetobacter sp.]MBT51723.1 hypothetical protein [Acinetobacter sp.]MCU4589100.1 hypothetical protein [Acinetobacter ursingii]|tara:strand:+ start:167 stop:526 length:360 start_codon:yes stop_codon:yes gene_type:complete